MAAFKTPSANGRGPKRATASESWGRGPAGRERDTSRGQRGTEVARGGQGGQKRERGGILPDAF